MLKASVALFTHIFGEAELGRDASLPSTNVPGPKCTDTAEAAAPAPKPRAGFECDHGTAPLSPPHLRPSQPGGHRPAPTRARRPRSRGRTRRGPKFCPISGRCICPGPAQTGHLPGPKPSQPGSGRGQCGTAGRGKLGHRADAAQHSTARHDMARLGSFIVGRRRRVPGAAVPPCGAAGKLRRPRARFRGGGPAEAAPGDGTGSVPLVLLLFFPVLTPVPTGQTVSVN